MSIRLPAAEKLAKQLLELRPPRMEALEPRFFTAMAKVIMAYVDIDEQRQRTEEIMKEPYSYLSESSAMPPRVLRAVGTAQFWKRL